MTSRGTAELSVEAVLPVPPAQAFDLVLEELGVGLERRGMRLDPGPSGGIREARIAGRFVDVAKTRAWEPATRVVWSWTSVDWAASEPEEVELRFEPAEDGTGVRATHRGFGRPIAERGGRELAGWFATALLAPWLRETAPGALGEWITDRFARRPSGAGARETYRDPVYHRPNFLAILDGLRLRQGDRLLEVGCGGGAFLKHALESGCRASAVDHSEELLRVAADQNRTALREGRLGLVRATAGRVPFRDRRFSAAVMTGVVQFLDDPLTALREIHRTLAPRGRLALFAQSKALRGTPAAPEPMASRTRFYEPEQLVELARRAGFSNARAEIPDLGGYARRVGVPDDALRFFDRGSGGILLWAERGEIRSGPGAPVGRQRTRIGRPRSSRSPLSFHRPRAVR
jgi:SAM-dependent methyltransferase